MCESCGPFGCMGCRGGANVGILAIDSLAWGRVIPIVSIIVLLGVHATLGVFTLIASLI